MHFTVFPDLHHSDKYLAHRLDSPSDGEAAMMNKSHIIVVILRRVQSYFCMKNVLSQFLLKFRRILFLWSNH